jgi:hypothetical protein
MLSPVSAGLVTQLQEEVDSKTRKLNKLWAKYEEGKGNIAELQVRVFRMSTRMRSMAGFHGGIAGAPLPTSPASRGPTRTAVACRTSSSESAKTC